MTQTDISTEAVERLAAVVEVGHLRVSQRTVIAATLRAQSQRIAALEAAHEAEMLGVIEYARSEDSRYFPETVLAAYRAQKEK